MARRKVRHRSLTKYSIGDMRHRITIHVRNITAPDYNSVDFSEAYNAGTEEWAFVATPTILSSGKAVFDGVNLAEGTSHVFVTRFDSSYTEQNEIRWEGDSYDILKTDDPDKREMYLIFHTRLRGDETLEANQ